MDLSSLITTLMDSQNKDGTSHELDKVYESVVMTELMNSLMSTNTTTNDLASFKKYLESTDRFDEYLSAIQYEYNFNWSVFVREGNEISGIPGRVVKSDVSKLLGKIGFSGLTSTENMGAMSSMGGMMSAGLNVWQEMLKPLKEDSDSLVNDVLKEQYELIDEGGKWPTAPNEVVLVVDRNNEISDLSLFALGLRTEAEMDEKIAAVMNGQQIDTSNRMSWDYETIRKMEFRLILASECYELQEDGTLLDLSQTDEGMEKLYTDPNVGFTLKVVGIIRPREGVEATSLSGSIGYTAALAEEALKRTSESELIKLQKDNPDTDIITGLPFSTLLTLEEKILFINTHLTLIGEDAAKEFLLTFLKPYLQAQMDEATLNMMPSSVLLSLILPKDDDADMIKQGKVQVLNTIYNAIPNEFSTSTYNDNLVLLGDVNKDNPKTIYLYSSSFEDKDKIGELIQEYNSTVPEEKQISYTDYVKLLMSSITTVLNAITYVLIAFVAISLVVSSIMIGIITYISVLERTKEIGILRAIGASKRDVGRVFNAETLIVGFVAGMIGIGSTLILNQIVNKILFHFTEIPNLKAVLPVAGAVILVTISMLLTFIAGLLPSRFAAKKNPVEALRSE